MTYKVMSKEGVMSNKLSTVCNHVPLQICKGKKKHFNSGIDLTFPTSQGMRPRTIPYSIQGLNAFNVPDKEENLAKIFVVHSTNVIASLK